MPNAYDVLSMEAVFEALPHVIFTREEQRNRSRMLQHIRTLPSVDQETLNTLAMRVVAEREARKKAAKEQKRKRDATGREQRRTRSRVEASRSAELEEFAQVPSPEVLAQCQQSFLDATTNAALATTTCVVCARESGASDCTSCIIDELPNVALLVNAEVNAHCPRYQQYIILVDHLVINSSGKATGKVCAECIQALTRRKRPKYALAHGLWLGETPPELQNLTHPEELLLGLQFPRVFFYKLRPKDRFAGENPEQRQRAMVGNLVSFACNVEKVADMIAGNLMPRPPAVLASVLAVSIVGHGKPPKKWLNATFRVRRQRVREALEWLIAHNPLYAGVTLSNARLDSLPEDSIPVEIALNLRHTTDEGAATREAESYVPNDSFEGTSFAAVVPPCLNSKQTTPLQGASLSSWSKMRRMKWETTIKEVRSQAPIHVGLQPHACSNSIQMSFLFRRLASKTQS